MKPTLQKFALALVLMGLAFAALELAKPATAHAGPIAAGMLVTDGGTAASTNTLCLDSPNGLVTIQSVTGIPYCLKTTRYDGGSQTVSCSTDYRPIQLTTVTEFTDGGGATLTRVTSSLPQTFGPFEMGPERCLTARAVDGGDPFLTVFRNTKNGP